jgi:hypothetical protein
MVRCGSNCTGIDILLYLLPGDLRRYSEPRRLSDCPESLWREESLRITNSRQRAREKSLRTLDRELAMESGPVTISLSPCVDIAVDICLLVKFPIPYAGRSAA